MSITTELREWWLHKFPVMDSELHRDFVAIAGRIDIAHKHAIGYVADYDSETMAENGWIKLPKDADGEHIHIGDEMEGVDKYDPLKKVMGKVIAVNFESDGIVDVAIQAWNSDGKSWHRAYLDPNASIYRHYHAPTVEDVLDEFFGKANLPDGTQTRAEIIAEYAAKLRLAGDAE